VNAALLFYYSPACPYHLYRQIIRNPERPGQIIADEGLLHAPPPYLTFKL
jgi:hypothetical protein